MSREPRETWIRFKLKIRDWSFASALRFVRVEADGAQRALVLSRQSSVLSEGILSEKVGEAGLCKDAAYFFFAGFGFRVFA